MGKIGVSHSLDCMQSDNEDSHISKPIRTFISLEMLNLIGALNYFQIFHCF